MDVAAPTIVGGTTLGSLSVSSAGDLLGSGISSALTIKSGIDGTSHTLALGTAGSTDTLANLAQTINNAGYGITATVDKSGTDLTFTQNAGNTVAAGVTGAAIDNSYSETSISIAKSNTLGSMTVNNSNDTVYGMQINSHNTVGAADTALDLSTVGKAQTLYQIAQDFNSGLQAGNGISAVLSNNGDTLTFVGSSANNSVTPTASSFTDVNAGAATLDASIVTTAGSGNLGVMSVNNADDFLSGTINYTAAKVTGGSNSPTAFDLNTGSPNGQTLTEIAADFNTGAEKGLGITAQLTNNNTTLTFNSNALSTDTGQPSINTTTTGAAMTDDPLVVAGGGAAGSTD